MSNTTLKTWFLMSRPHLLTVSVSSVFIGSAMAYGDGIMHLNSACIAFLAVLLIHIGTNFTHQYRHNGPLDDELTASISPVIIKATIALSFLLAVPAVLYLIKRAGLQMTLFAGALVSLGLYYSAKKKSIKYWYFSDLFFMIFLGPVVVAGSYYIQSHEINTAVCLAGFAPGLMAVAISTINNIRDIDTDKKNGKMTLAVCYGRPFAIKKYFFTIVAAITMPILIYFRTNDYRNSLIAVLTLLLIFTPLLTVLTKTDERSLNKAILFTVRLLVIYSVLFSIGWVL